MNTKLHDEFIAKSNLRGLLALFGDWLIIFAIAWISMQFNSILIYLAAVWLIGSIQFAIGEALLHEASHNHLFKSVKLNHYLRVFYTFPFFNVFSDYKKEHFAHHKFLGDADKDHIAQDYILYGLDKNTNFFIVWFIKPLFGISGYYYSRFILEKIKNYPGSLLGFWFCTLFISVYFSFFP